MNVHELKVLPEFYASVEDGTMTFQVRRDDRNFEVGHHLRLREWSHERGFHNDVALEWQTREITYVLRGEQALTFGVQPGFCVLGLSPAMEMALCESESLCLRPDTPYIFRVYPNCKRCAEMASAYTEAVQALG